MGSFFLLIALTLPIIIYISDPLFQTAPVSPVDPDTEALQHLTNKKTALISAIRELDEENADEEISSQVSSRYRSQLIQQTASITQKIHLIQEQIAEKQADVMIENYLTLNTRSKPKIFCAKCNNPIQSGDLFCAHCGEKVADPH